MANEEHVRILLNSVTGFNAWRADNPDIMPDFYHANLGGANLSGANLSGAILTNAKLTNANFTNANLTDANLSGADLTSANFTNADLINANLGGANFSNAKLAGSRLDHRCAKTLLPFGTLSAAARGILITHLKAIPVK